MADLQPHDRMCIKDAMHCFKITIIRMQFKYIHYNESIHCAANGKRIVDIVENMVVGLMLEIPLSKF